MRLAGFYRYPIKINLEEDISIIEVEDEDKKITGRLDILAVSKAEKTKTNAFCWILVIESKNSGIAVSEGLPQLLTYTHDSLKHQESVWGLITNGQDYQFVYILQGNPPTYQLMPILHLMEAEHSVQLLQVMKAICQM
jgi:hypothetical protein